MTARTSHILLVFSAFLGGLVIFLGVILFATGHLSSGVTGPSAIGGPFNLVDQDGKPITDRDMKGRPFLVFFGYTHCPDICPTTLFDLSEMLHAMGNDADRVQALFVTVDPDRDTPAVMKDYLSSFNPHLRGVTGDQQAIAAAEKAYRVYAKKVPIDHGDYSMDHTALVYLMDKQGRFVAPFNLKRKPAEAAADLRRYL
jgi:protein SCO1/2